MSSVALLPPETAVPDVSDVPRGRRVLSTAHSRRHSGLVGALLVVVVIFAGLEFFTRTVLFRASKDFSRFATYDRKSGELVQQPGMRIAFIGNSLTGEGVDPQMFANELGGLSAESVAAKLFTADASKINVWHYLVNRHFWRPERHPDLLVVNFYENNLVDGHPLEIGRFAQFFAEPCDWPEVFAHDVTGFGERLEFLLSSSWATFAARDRIKERVLGVVVPHYRELTIQTNDIRKQQRAAIVEVAAPKKETHEVLKRFLARANEHHSKIVFVAFPTIIPGRERPYQPYELNPETLRIIREAGMEFLDLRQVPELTPEMYADDIHLNEIGRPIYSRYLAKELSSITQRLKVSKQQ